MIDLLLQDGGVRTNTEQMQPCQDILGLFCRREIDAGFHCNVKGEGLAPGRFKTDDARIKLEEPIHFTMIKSRH